MTAKRFNDCLEKLCDGDDTGLECIYSEYYEAIKMTVRIKGKSNAIAEKVASAFFTALKKGAHEIKGVENPTQWVFESANKLIEIVEQKSEKFGKLA